VKGEDMRAGGPRTQDFHPQNAIALIRWFRVALSAPSLLDKSDVLMSPRRQFRAR